MFGPVQPALAANHRVIAVDLQGHGRTADIDRPIDVRLMADDIAALLDGGKRDGGWIGEGRPAGGHALAILPGLTHCTIIASPLLAAAAVAFLDK